MRVIVGTSGYSYKEWKGTFYPEDLPASKMLPFYAEHFGAVEINNTFYRMPQESLVAKWASEVPHGFTFVLKAPSWLSPEKGLARFLDVASGLGPKLGPLLFRWELKKNISRLRELLEAVPQPFRVVMDFRHESWNDDEVYAALRERDAALCASDTDETPDPDQVIVPTASWGYLRLRRAEYSRKELAAWARRVQAQAWSEAYVFFKHEDEGKGPAFAKRFLAVYSSRS